ncbi:hypothetical protein IF1G_01037 [Cordyceps javanica]|uniref:Uncharacterized protein n=1 Tax=Cordyceps javanica TaxID=43265 RepID=A0A545VHF5_9HYPO|nr:hypothetical protein IF1G_01037 [Cordyceps javanica]
MPRGGVWPATQLDFSAIMTRHNCPRVEQLCAAALRRHGRDLVSWDCYPAASEPPRPGECEGPCSAVARTEATNRQGAEDFRLGAERQLGGTTLRDPLL